MQKPGHRISIRVKVATVLLVVIGVLLGVFYFVGRVIILDSYLLVEDDHGIVNAERINDGFKEDINQLSLNLRDWARWDDSYRFVLDQNQEYIDANLGVGSISNLEMDGMVFFDVNQNLIFSRMIDQPTVSEVSSENLVSYLLAHADIFLQDSDTAESSGIILLPEGPFFISSHAILQSDGSGPSAGTLVFAQMINDSILDDLSARTHLSFTVQLVDDAKLPLDMSEAFQRLLQGTDIHVQSLSDDVLASYFFIKDPTGLPIFIVRVDDTRDIFATGKQTVNIFTEIICFTAIILWAIVTFLIEWLVLNNLVRMNGDLRNIRKSKDHKGRVRMFARDEIGGLSFSINALLDELAAAQEQADQKNVELLQQVQLVNDAKKAILNLLEDIEADKAKVEETVVQRTKELSEERIRLSASIQSLQLGFILFDSTGQAIIVNSSFKQIFNYTKKNLRVHDVVALLKDLPDLEANIASCLQEGKNFTSKDVIYNDKYVSLFMNVVKSDKEDGYLGGVLLIEDVTAAKLVDKAKTEFVSVASHQLRTPLSTINWYLELLKSGDSGPLTADQQTFVTEIAQSSERMVALVNTLLDVSRLDLGDLEMSRLPTDIKALVESVLAELKYKVSEQKIILRKEFDSHLPLVPTDAKYFTMVIQNLISNALKYTPEAGLVTVGLSTLAKGNTFGGKTIGKKSIGLSVTDTGYGIPQDQQSKIFEKFFRADNVLDKDEPGTGLGLYIVRSTMMALGGDVWFTSTLGQGTTFYVTLPLIAVKKGPVKR